MGSGYTYTEGRNLGKGIGDFITEGTYLANEAPIKNAYIKRAGELLKKYGKLKFPSQSRKKTKPQLTQQCQEENTTVVEIVQETMNEFCQEHSESLTEPITE
jgi:hypothetical protein